MVNSLCGGPGLDWYFAGMRDVLCNKTDAVLDIGFEFQES
jgi:hypothetical protein